MDDFHFLFVHGQDARAAKAAYNANRVYCEAIGDVVPLPWLDLTDEEKLRFVDAVNRLRHNSMVTPAEQHAAWCVARREQGWVLGPRKDEQKREHPNLVPYDALPKEQKVKDKLFREVVLSIVVATK